MALSLPHAWSISSSASIVLNTTGITATAGVGTNLYLAKIAMDILAKHVKVSQTSQQDRMFPVSVLDAIWLNRLAVPAPILQKSVSGL